MSARKCVTCGKDPAEGFASVYQDGAERWYCHGDDGPSCYTAEPEDPPFGEMFWAGYLYEAARQGYVTADTSRAEVERMRNEFMAGLRGEGDGR